MSSILRYLTCSVFTNTTDHVKPRIEQVKRTCYIYAMTSTIDVRAHHDEGACGDLENFHGMSVSVKSRSGV